MSLGKSPRDSQETSPPTTPVDPIARVEQQPVKANIRTIATRLDEALRAVMTLLGFFRGQRSSCKPSHAGTVVTTRYRGPSRKAGGRLEGSFPTICIAACIATM
jgi:hypothetical protein